MVKNLKAIAVILMLSMLTFASCGRTTPEDIVTTPPTTLVTTEAQTTHIPPTPIVIVVTATEPTSTPTSATDNLDSDIKEWNVYTEGAPLWDLKNVDMPSLDGESLQCSITGGDPFSNVHCYRNLPPESDANVFTLSMSFQFTPDTTCDNQGDASVVQAIEFTMNKWDKGRRYEFALQWENVGDDAPQWRYWDANQPPGDQWVALNPNINQCLKADEWHTFTLYGRIMNDQVYYQGFTINDQTHNLDLTVSPAAVPEEIDRLALAIQLDGNSEQAPYDIFIDKVNFVREVVTPERSTPTATIRPTSEPIIFTETPSPPPQEDCSGAKIDVPPPDSNGQVDKAVKISWTPSSCQMNVQFYQGGVLVRENKSGDFSGTVDMNNLPSGLTEIKIWVPGSGSPADAILVQIK